MVNAGANNHRRSIRLRGYDYVQSGAYFVTICTFARQGLWGEIAQEIVELSEAGRIVNDEWLRSAEVRENVCLDVFQIMPNHLHGIVVFDRADSSNSDVGAHSRAPFSSQPRSLGSVVAGFKSATTKRINEQRGSPGVPVWQRNYYERVIRNEQELRSVRQYIVDNPAKWAADVENPRNHQRRRQGARLCAPTYVRSINRAFRIGKEDQHGATRTDRPPAPGDRSD